jgi:HlyD family secretion protein
MKKTAVALLLLLLIVGGLFFWRQQPLTVDAETPRPLAFRQSLVATGRVQTEATLAVRAETDGRLRTLAAEGKTVRAGEVLAELDDPDGEVQVAQAEAAVRAAELEWQRLGQQDRPQALLRRDQAQVLRQQAQRQLDNLNALKLSQNVSADALAAARETLALRDSDLQQAELTLAAVREGGIDSRRREAALAQARAQARSAQLRQSRARVASPVAGVVLQRQVQPGERVRAGDSLLELAAVQGREVVADLDERWLPQLAVGQSATLLADAWPDRPFAAQITRISPGVDSLRGTVRLRLGAAQWPEFLREGLTLSVQIGGGEVLALTVPATALTQAEGRSGVWLVRAGRAEFRAVRAGRKAEGRVEILSGLTAGETVVTQPAGLKAGQPLRPRSRAP